MFAENVLVGVTRMSRVPFGRSYRYFLKTNGASVRISKDLYRQIKMMIEPRV